MIIDDIFALSRRFPLLHRLIRPVGGPVYRRVLMWQYQRQRRHSAWAFPAALAPATGLAIMGGTYEPATANLLLRVLLPGDTFFDIGANVGYMAALAALAVGPTGRVVAVEPEPENFFCLSQNTRRWEHVACVAAACSDQNGLVPLLISSHAACHSLVDTGSYLAGSTRLTPAFTFDRLCEFVALDGPAVVKIDVEGAEPLVLRGMAQALAADNIRHLIIEFGPQLLRNAGFEPRSLWDTLHPAFDLMLVDATPGVSAEQALSEASFDQLTAYLLAQPRPTTVNLWAQRREPRNSS